MLLKGIFSSVSMVISDPKNLLIYVDVIYVRDLLQPDEEEEEERIEVFFLRQFEVFLQAREKSFL